MSDRVPVGSGVSRETEARLRRFAELVLKWSGRINLVAPGDLPDLWQRHVVDSMQLAPLAPASGGDWLDIGSGGGFPGLVLAILFDDSRPDITMTLVEADRRKAAFLHHAAQALDLRVRILTARSEAVDPQGAAVVSARALAPLAVLLGHAARHLAPGGRGVFPKGRAWQQEVAKAREEWQFSLTTRSSLTDPEARILVVEGLSRA
ncbi:MAG: 16S rRNA (guanine(527)-N(7))-methyltransferase RsmG [Rubellimicrobium sp.]|nr:16S rRNA (guanine(527)-N(7))-methyltransferase RsmG [Rubellimicrobium sp.]